MLLCRDCAHIRPAPNYEGVGRLSLCAKSLHPCPVDGHTEASLCWDVRSKHGICGPEARLFEAKPGPQLAA